MTINTVKSVPFKKVWHQYFAVIAGKWVLCQVLLKLLTIRLIAANVIVVAHWAIIGWVSPALPLLLSDDTPLISGPLSVSEMSWLGSIISIGGVTGNLLFTYLTTTIGRKRAIIFLAFPQTAFWLLVLFGNHVYHLLLARYLAGCTGGGIFICIPIFVTEIADSK